MSGRRRAWLLLLVFAIAPTAGCVDMLEGAVRDDPVRLHVYLTLADGAADAFDELRANVSGGVLLDEDRSSGSYVATREHLDGVVEGPVDLLAYTGGRALLVYSQDIERRMWDGPDVHLVDLTARVKGGTETLVSQVEILKGGPALSPFAGDEIHYLVTAMPEAEPPYVALSLVRDATGVRDAAPPTEASGAT